MDSAAARNRALVRANQVIQINHGAVVAGLVLQLFNLLESGDLSRKEFPAAYIAVSQFGHERAALLMAQFVETYREAAAPDQVHAEPLLAAFDADAAYGRAAAALDQVTMTVIDANTGELSEYHQTRFGAVSEEYAVTAARQALAAGRGTLVFSCAANGTKWRRVTSATPCAFCAMLATREDYLTKESALRVVGRASGYGTAEYKATGRLYYGGVTTRGGSRNKKGSQRLRGTRPMGERYHDNCGCTVAEVVGDWERTDAEKELYGLYYDAREELAAEGGDPLRPLSTTEILARMRKMSSGRLSDGAPLKSDPASVTGLTEAQFEARLNAAMDAGDWDLAERLGELWDAKQAQPATTPQTADPGAAFNTETYDWFEGLSDDEQLDFVDTLPERYREDFWREQWAHISGRSARRDVPTEREIRAEWDNYIDLEWLRLEEETRGNVLSREAAAKGRDPRDLWRVNSRTARSWASEETRRYWDEHGRLAYAEFRAAALGSGLSDLQAGKGGGYWA